MQNVVIHTDGACKGNPGPGGWAAILTCGGHSREVSGAEPDTTNNRMELQAAIEAFAALKEPCAVVIHTDSNYLKNGITRWVHGWKRNGWTTMKKEPVKNEDLWKRLDSLARIHQVTWKWLKGHAGHAENERCDLLANQAIEKMKSTKSPVISKKSEATILSVSPSPKSSEGAKPYQQTLLAI